MRGQRKGITQDQRQGVEGDTKARKRDCSETTLYNWGEVRREVKTGVASRRKLPLEKFRICGTFSAEGGIFMLLLLLLLGQPLMVLLWPWGARKPSESWDQNVGVAKSRRGMTKIGGFGAGGVCYLGPDFVRTHEKPRVQCHVVWFNTATRRSNCLRVTPSYLC